MSMQIAKLPRGTTDRTMSLWTNVTSSREAQGLVAWGNARNGAAFSLMIHPAHDNNFVVSVWGPVNDIASGVKADGTWHHLVGVYDGTLRIYVDGVHRGQGGRGVDTTLSQLFVGSQVNGIQRSQGLLDDFRIYNRALSAREVKALYDFERTPPAKITKRKPVLRRKSTTPPLAVAPFDERQAKAHQTAWARNLGTRVEMSNSIEMKLVLIPPGEFTMGSPASEADRGDNETQHLVQITKPFYLSVHEVAQEQYERVMGENPSAFSTLGEGKGYVP